MASELLRRRTAARGWLTRARRSLAEVFDSDDVDRSVLGDAVEEFDRRLSTLDEVQSEYELVCDDMDTVIEEAADYRDNAREVRKEAIIVLVRIEKEEAREAASEASSMSSATRAGKPDVKLPKLVLPKFTGDVLEWQAFWDQFMAVVHNSDLPEISKFTYLRSLLEGEAKEAIEGLSLTTQHYTQAREILEKRFGRKERIIFEHVQGLLASQLGKQPSLPLLRRLQDSLLSHVRSLECLAIDGNQYGVLLTPIVLSCLPADIRMEWARGSEGKESDLAWLLDFLDKELKLRETSQAFRTLKTHEMRPAEEKQPKPSVTVLQTQSTSDNTCSVCSKPHVTSKCWDLVKVSQWERKEKVMRKGLCFRCLGRGHLAASCTVMCERCKGPHHLLFCRKPKNAVSGKDAGRTVEKPTNATVAHTGVCTLTAQHTGSEVVMQTVEVNVKGMSGLVKANVLFDNGSDRSYISSELVGRVDAEFVRSERVGYCCFGSGKASKEEDRNVYSVELRGQKTGSGVITVTEVPVVCAPLYRRPVPEEILADMRRRNMAEDYRGGKRIQVDILIGLDHYWKFMTSDCVALRDDKGLIAQRTLFGWIISGSYGAKQEREQKSSRVSHQLLCIQSVRDTELQQLWDIGLDEDVEMPENPVLRGFKEKVVMKHGRYEVTLPWKQDENRKKLMDNFSQAEQRLNSLNRKLAKDDHLKERYNEAFREMENQEVIEEVPPEERETENQTFYMPHRPVVRESSVSTKVRPVFDASAQGQNGVSLNECVETGPNLIPSLVKILVRFRRWPIAIVADIQKAFLQIAVRPEDRDVHRFLWSDNGRVRVMRFARVPFGNRSSPFILNATIKHHLEKFEPTNVVAELEENLYVDDWLTGADGESEATHMIQEASDVMSQCSMNLTKWGSNNKEVLDKVLYNLSDKCEHMCNVKVLGLRWNPGEDSFLFEGVALEQGLIITKRVVLSLVARLFDPLGFLNPFVIKLKCLFQDLWRLGVEWDDEVSEDISRQVQAWIEGLSALKNWRVPRPYTGGPWRDIVSIHLEAFGDASERAYGACVYMVAEQGGGAPSSALVLAKAKVAPVKKVTLPRLELLGAVLAAQLLGFVRSALRLDRDCCRCWSDSTVTLSWIKGDASRWKPFVANRVGQVQQLTSPSQWSHCPGDENPADLLTRGVSAQELMDSELWLRGPRCMFGESKLDESELEDVAHVIGAEESGETLLSVTPDQSQLFEVDRWGKLTTAIRVVGWVLRFLHNLRVGRKSGELSLGEMVQAKLVLTQSVQRQAFPQEMRVLEQGGAVSRKSQLYKCTPYLDEDGLMRMKGRLDRSELTFNEKHPIIVPRSHFAVIVVCFQHQLLKHAGVNAMLVSLRGTYWIMGARRIAKRVKRQCVSCQKQDAKPVEQPIAPLHESRVTKIKPFAVVGIDHAGPMYCADRPGKKFYILLFTCAAIRAVHLELVDSLNLEDCLLAIRRFIARRGVPSVIWSDNAKTFVAAKQKLFQNYGVELCPQWNYIVPRSPWWGGWWERMVRSVKAALRKSVGKKSLTRTELETTLHEVEACVNSRPLTFVGDGVEDRSPLTPAHFLLGRSQVYEKEKQKPSVQELKDVTKKTLEERKSIQESLLDRFWSIWLEEYIRSLPPWRGTGRESSLGEGSLVMIREDGCPRLAWPVGVVVETYLGKDGVVRSCKVKTQKGDFVRSVQRLHHLELDSGPLVQAGEKGCSQGGVDEVPSVQVESTTSPEPTTVDPVRVSRFGRKIKQVQKLDL